jgi:hypothetical protein
MALSVAGLKTRMGRDVGLQTYGSLATSYDDLISDSVSEYISLMDSPIVTGSISVTAGNVGPYAVPDAIGKLRDIRNAAGKSVVYSYDTDKKEITLQEAAATDQTYTVYGTIEDVKTNIGAAVAAIPEEHERLLMGLIRAYAAYFMRESNWVTSLQSAQQLCKNERLSRNRLLNMDYMAVPLKDSRGNIIDDPANASGYSPAINDFLGNELR